MKKNEKDKLTKRICILLSENDWAEYMEWQEANPGVSFGAIVRNSIRGVISDKKEVIKEKKKAEDKGEWL